MTVAPDARSRHPDIREALKGLAGTLFPAGLLKILHHQRWIENIRILALGVVDEYRASSVAAGSSAILVRKARGLGYEDCEMSWILGDNVAMNGSLAAMGAKRNKTYRIYE